MPTHSGEDMGLLLTKEKKLLHELQVHQIELEMQNEALQEALAKSEIACINVERERERVLELFDFAPVAYFTLEENHAIRAANIYAASLLGLNRSQLIGQNFSSYISADYRPTFKRFMSELFLNQQRQSHEISLQIGELQRWIAIEAIANSDQKSCLLAILDITARKQNESGLIENQAFLASILNSMKWQIAVLNHQGVILAVNNAWIEFGHDNGLPPQSLSMLGINYLAVCKNQEGHFVDEDAEKACTGIQAVLSGEQQQFILEYPCHSSDQQRWFNMVVSPLTGPKYGAVVSHEDITQRKLDEFMPNLVKTMFDISMDGFWELDSDGNVLSINDAYAKISGYSVDELTQMNISQLEVIEDLEQVKTHIAKIKAQGYDLFETCHRHKDGHIIDVEVSAVYLPQFNKLCAFCRDISQRKKTEGMLSAIFNNSSEGIIAFDLYRRIISGNPAVKTIFGYTPKEMIGSDINQFIPRLGAGGHECHCVSGFEQQKSKIEEVEGLHKSGSTVYLELSNAVYRFNNACYFVIIVRDISLRKKREASNKAHLDELAHITRLGLMGEMASGIAHEVNQPLSAICNYTHAAVNHLNAKHYDHNSLVELLNKIQQQSLRAGEIIHRMREFIRANPQKRSTVEINDLVQVASNLCHSEYIKSNIQLTYHFENELPPIQVDHIQIEQVLINLIRNSIDSLQSLPKNQPRLLSIQTQLIDENTLQVRVKDNGSGITEANTTKVFTPFFTTKGMGMGMGLSICRSLIESHNGDLFFNTSVGKGTTFYFQLPINHENK